MAPKKILYLESNTDGTIGGSYFSLLYLIKGLDKAKYVPYVVFLQDNVLVPEYKKVTPFVFVRTEDDSLFSKIRCRLIRRLLVIYKDLFLKYRQMKTIIKEMQPDLVHLNNSYEHIDGWALACYLNNVRIIAHDRGTGFPCSWRTKFFTRFLDGIISVSDSFRDNVFRQNLQAKFARRVYNGMDCEEVSAAGKDELSRLRREFGCSESDRIVGIVGNVDRWKGQMIVLRAMQKVLEVFPDTKCLIVGAVCKGAESYLTELENHAGENGLSRSVIFTGYRKDVLNIMSLLDVLIHASIEPEPFARVILEGMALGKPIIGTNSGGTPEQIVHGETGLLVPMNDADAMADALVYYLSDIPRAREIGGRGMLRLKTTFSIRRMVDETEKIYAEVLGAD